MELKTLSKKLLRTAAGAGAVLLCGALLAQAQVTPTPSLPLGPAGTSSVSTTSSTNSSTAPTDTSNSSTSSTVPAGPFITLGSTSGYVGDMLDLQGGGFANSEPLTIDFGGITSTTSSDTGGFFHTAIVVPTGPISNTPITATGGWSGRMAQTVFDSLGATTSSQASTTAGITPGALSTTTTPTTTIPLALPATTTTATSSAATGSSGSSYMPQWPPTFTPKPAVVQIGTDGSVLLRGTLADITGTTLSIRAWGGVWTVTLSPTASALPRLAQMSPGDFIGVLGTIAASDSAPLTIDATVVRDWTVAP